MLLIILIVVKIGYIWSTLVEQLLKKFGWVIALGLIMLLILVVVVVTINRSDKELTLTDRLNKPGEELKVDNNIEPEIIHPSLIKKSIETNMDIVESNPTKTMTKEEIKIPNKVIDSTNVELSIVEQDGSIANIVESNPTKTETKEEIKILNQVIDSTNLELIIEEQDNSSNTGVVMPGLIDEPSEIDEVKGNLSSLGALVDNNDQVFDESQKDGAVEIDIMRIDSQREALVAGRSEPNSTIEVLADGHVIGSAQSDDQGQFVVMGTLGETVESQTLTVRSSIVPSIEKKTTKTSFSSSTLISNSEQQEESNNYLEWTLSDDIFVVLPSLTESKSVEASNSNSVPVIVQSSSSDIKIIQNNEQALISGVSIDSISYSDFGEAVLVGRGNANNKVLVYLNNILASSSNIGALGGWSTELKGILPGIYKLRIDEVDFEGEVQSRIATPFKKESKDFLMNMVSGSITVQTGNSLWRIARRIFGEGIRYIEIYDKNNDLIEDPNLIYPGQVFSIPTQNYDS